MTTQNGTHEAEHVPLEVWLEQQRATTAVPLPSGLTVEIRRTTIIDLFTDVDIPTPMVQAVEKMINGAQKGEALKVELSEMAKLKDVLRLVAREVIVSPELTDFDKGEPGKLPVSMIPYPDLIHLFEVVGGMEAAQNFRNEPGANA